MADAPKPIDPDEPRVSAKALDGAPTPTHKFDTSQYDYTPIDKLLATTFADARVMLRGILREQADATSRAVRLQAEVVALKSRLAELEAENARLSGAAVLTG